MNLIGGDIWSRNFASRRALYVVIKVEMAMTQITPPRQLPGDGDRLLECEFALDLPVRHLIDDALNAGWDPREVFAALRSLVGHQRNAYGEDPDPADDPNWITASTHTT